MSFRTRVQKALLGQYPSPASPPGSLWKTRDISADYTATVEDSGTMFITNAADIVLQLPSTSLGLTYGLMTKTLSVTTGASLSPAAADAIDANSDGADFVNTGATDAVGDNVVVVGDGDAGWLIISVKGTWTA